MKKVMVVFGTRPEAIKMAPLCHELKSATNIDLKICTTGQHREMLSQVMDLFTLKADYELDIMNHGQDLTDITSIIILKMRTLLKETCPDLVLVHGDTSSAFATAMACFYHGIFIGHVEAGLRTHNIHEPFPEEFNRQSIGLIANYHFAPTKLSKQNLLNENKDDSSICVTGNTVIDALHLTLDVLKKDKNRLKNILNSFNKKFDFDWQKTKYVLITGHRRENFGKGFLSICEALNELSKINRDIHFIYPVHLNPNVQKPVNKILSNISNIHLIDPLEYHEFIVLLDKSYIVLTDSGGIQEEAPSLGKPVLVMRDVTERPEAVDAGTVKLVGSSKQEIIKNVNELLNNNEKYIKMSKAHNPYGDGKASKRILKFIKQIKK